MARFVYADHAATTPLSPTAQAAMEAQFGNPSSLYHLGQEAHSALEAARTEAAAAINADPRSFYFTSGGTESDNWAIRGILEAQRSKGSHVIVSAIEHHAILHTLSYLERLKLCTVTLLPVDSEGFVDPDELERAIRPDTVLVSIMAANNEIGTIEPIAQLAEAAHRHGVLFHTDAVQAVGHIPVDVKEWGCDLLSLSGHKCYGPRGTGALYVRRGVYLPPLIHGGGQERGLRSGTENVAGAAGLAAAMTESVAELAQEGPRLAALRDRLMDGLLSAIPRSRVTGSRTCRLPGTASMIFECVEGESILLRLDALGICASSGSACSSVSLDPSHVLLAIGLPHEVAHGSLRLSLGRDTTQADVDYILESLPPIISTLRAMSPLWY